MTLVHRLLNFVLMLNVVTPQEIKYDVVDFLILKNVRCQEVNHVFFRVVVVFDPLLLLVLILDRFRIDIVEFYYEHLENANELLYLDAAVFDVGQLLLIQHLLLFVRGHQRLVLLLVDLQKLFFDEAEHVILVIQMLLDHGCHARIYLQRFQLIKVLRVIFLEQGSVVRLVRQDDRIVQRQRLQALPAVVRLVIVDNQIRRLVHGFSRLAVLFEALQEIAVYGDQISFIEHLRFLHQSLVFVLAVFN